MSAITVRQRQAIDWNLCLDIARQHGRSFYLASHMLRGDQRRSILAAYAYCRLADDIVDRPTGSQQETRELLRAWESELDDPRHPVAIAFVWTCEEYGISDRPVRELFDGLRADMSIDRYETWAELRNYCYQVAGTVGLIVAPILGCKDPLALPRAAELGIAMQLTNILRDVGEDAAMGRIYLPLQELARFGIDTDGILHGNPGATFPEFMEFQLQRARDLYRHALAATPALSSSGRLTTLAAAQLYAGILDEIESNGFDVFGRRACVPRSQKARHAASAVGQFVRMSVPMSGNRALTSTPPVSVPPEHDTGGWIR